ncbi:MAG: acetyltransferase [Odoribacteraceae bacterium]|jgi:sugar O-acyltransferase (sialic acid O-acetyltransferase NeuD family)|nr:acetyltransferase [Odoribacteraceae bacterium]
MYLYGASGHAKVIIDILVDNNVTVEGLYDDNSSVTELLGYPVSRVHEVKGPLIVSIGYNAVRKKIVQSLDVLFGTAKHSSAIISSEATIQEGSVVMQGAIIQSCATIGRHCIVNTGASVGHDCRVGDYVHVSPHSTLCGNVTIGEGSWIGAGSTVIPGIKIGKWSIIGAGSVVVRDIPDNVLAFGNGCKIIKNTRA